MYILINDKCVKLLQYFVCVLLEEIMVSELCVCFFYKWSEQVMGVPEVSVFFRELSF